MKRLRWLFFLYPVWWRRHYGDEAMATLERTPWTWGVIPDLLLGAVDAWLHQWPPRREFRQGSWVTSPVLSLAQSEAHGLAHHYVGTEHLLLGLMADRASIGAEALAALDIEQEAVRARVVELIGLGSSSCASHCLGLTPRAKRVLERARREAARLDDGNLATASILLALLQENQGIAALVLSDLGADPHSVREQLTRLMDR
jgi:hypothetical protein